MKLYHFTALFYLPEIIEGGIAANGEIPLDCTTAYDQIAKAVNLTANGSRQDQANAWAHPDKFMIDKTEIRLTVDLPESQLTTFRQLKERHKIPSNFLATIPMHVRKHWHFSFEPIPKNKIVAVDRLQDGDYRPLSEAELSGLVQEIKAELDRAFIIGVVPTGRMKGARCIEWKDGVTSSWLTTRFHNAD